MIPSDTVNRLAQFLQYTLKVFDLKGLLRRVRDGRGQPDIPLKSRSRCCPCCCQRQVEVADADGQKRKVTEYYHRYVFAQINGPKLNILLDVEPIRPGEDECAAALRLLGRVRRLYGPRFFDGITVDAW